MKNGKKYYIRKYWSKKKKEKSRSTFRGKGENANGKLDSSDDS